jgi:DNA polymerase III alpha subunit
LGFPLRCHPLDLFKDALGSTPYIQATDLPRYIGQEVTLIGWLLTEKIVSTKKGEPMEFMTLEDQTAIYDATAFPATYRNYCHLLATNQAYLITGLVEDQLSTLTVTVRHLRLLSSHDTESSEEPERVISA